MRLLFQRKREPYLFFGRHCHLYSNLCVLRTIHIREVCANVNTVESSRVKWKNVSYLVDRTVVATRDEIIANLHKTVHNLNGTRLKSIVMINSPYTK